MPLPLLPPPSCSLFATRAAACHMRHAADATLHVIAQRDAMPLLILRCRYDDTLHRRDTAAGFSS